MLFAAILFAIYCLFVSYMYPESKTMNTEIDTVFPEKVFDLLEEQETAEKETRELITKTSQESCSIIQRNQNDNFNTNTKISIESMDFHALRQVASKLRDAGYFSGKIRGKGVNKKSLTQKIENILLNHADAVKILA